MLDKIKGYLETNTNSDNIWVSIDTIIDDLFPDLQSDPSTMKEIFQFEAVISKMHMERIIRIQEDKESDGLNQFKVALESNINEFINGVKKSAVDEMKEELNNFVKNEDYENAAEYRDMISEYEKT
jgi:excinuclease UvrABC helicase subunit UvrB